jgi:hypothetical protein
MPSGAFIPLLSRNKKVGKSGQWAFPFHTRYVGTLMLMAGAVLEVIAYMSGLACYANAAKMIKLTHYPAVTQGSPWRRQIRKGPRGTLRRGP